MKSKIPEMTGVVLAGGKSRRMGRDKRRLEIHGKPLFIRVREVLESLFGEVLIVLAEPTPDLAGPGSSVVTDIIPNKGSLGGLYTGLYHASHDRVFVVGCDMPFLNPRTVERVCRFSTGFDLTLVKVQGRVQPMHGVYAKRCLPRMKAMIEEDRLRIQELASHAGLAVQLLEGSDLQDMDPLLRSFFNVNTPTDLERAERMPEC